MNFSAEESKPAWSGGRGTASSTHTPHATRHTAWMPAGIRERIALYVLLVCCSARSPQRRVVFLYASSPCLDPSQRNLLAHHQAAIIPMLSALRLRGGMPLPSQIPHEEGWKEERAKDKAEREEEARLDADQVTSCLPKSRERLGSQGFWMIWLKQGMGIRKEWHTPQHPLIFLSRQIRETWPKALLSQGIDGMWHRGKPLCMTEEEGQREGVDMTMPQVIIPNARNHSMLRTHALNNLHLGSSQILVPNSKSTIRSEPKTHTTDPKSQILKL